MNRKNEAFFHFQVPQQITSKFGLVLIQFKLIPTSDFQITTIYYETIYINNRNFHISKHPAIYIKENMNTINEMAELAFTSRLKHLSERLLKDVSRLYHKRDIDFEARWFTILYTLNRKSPMTVTSLARSLSLTAINHITSEMLKKRLLNSTKGNRDERQRLLIISTKLFSAQKVLTQKRYIYRPVQN